MTSHGKVSATGPPAGWDLVHEEVVVDGRTLVIERPRSAEDLIDEADYERDERLPYWAELWPSAHVLAGHLAARDLRGARVVELGCGVGLPSIVAALGGADVLATDWYDEALGFTRANAARAQARVATLLVDWREPPAALLARPQADLVVGADLLYEERNAPALAALVPRLLAAAGEIVIADPRRPHAPDFLDAMQAEGWHLATDEMRHGARQDESGPLVRLHRLTRAVPGA